MKLLYHTLFISFLMILTACGGKTPTNTNENMSTTPPLPEFNADSAFASIARQCAFGPRVLETEAHEQCGAYIINKFQEYGFTVSKQEATFLRYDGVKMAGYNIIAQSRPDAAERILIAAHWDSRPWADNDPFESNHHTPILGANAGASGVAVMIELARILHDSLPIVGIDLVCFDAEDAGAPQWETDIDDRSDSWCLGSQHWATHPHATGFRFGILLDMVGGQGAYFYREGYSMQYASSVMEQVWQAARDAGYGSFFKNEGGGYITDDHLPVNRIARIPMIDIVPFYPTGNSGFGPTWHTVNDTPENIDRNTLKAVGQTLLQLIYNL